jgi:beta-glucosidase
LQGLQLAVGEKTNILYAAGSEINSTDKSGFSKARALAKQSDAIIAVVGEHALMSGEALSRADIGLPGVQLDLLKMLKETGKPVIVVLMNGRPIAEPWMYENCDAVLETWLLGVQSGPAIADVIFGTYNPAGKLPVTIPRSVGQIPIYYNHKNTGRAADPADRYTSKYIDESFLPQYPFGYGLSYTTFDYGDLTLDKASFRRGDSLGVSVLLTNSGSVAGEEVVQLYVRDLFGSVTRPVWELKNFEKIFLDAGESRLVKFKIKSEDLRFWDKNMEFRSEAGQFKVFIGSNSATQLQKAFELLD